MRKILSIAICVMLLVETVVFGYDGLAENIRADATTITEYNTGDIIEFGSYPQTEEKDDDIISELNSLAGDNKKWTSYGYCHSIREDDDGHMEPSDYMRYTDLDYEGTKYRGVIFDSYRPYCMYISSAAYEDVFPSTYQDVNGYTTGSIYWFRYEPIKWRILDPSTGLVMCATAIDSQTYNNYTWHGVGSKSEEIRFYGDLAHTYYASDYAHSSIREWLNDDFYNAAFSAEQQNIIKTATLDNSSAYDSTFDSAITTDKIYLLSYNDITNSEYGFDSDEEGIDTSRQLKSSDYAKCQGIWVSADSGYNGISTWLLRSASHSSNWTCCVNIEGRISDCNYIYYTDSGVVPALNLNLTSDIIQSDASEISELETNRQDDKEADNDTVEEDIVDKSDDKESDDEKETEDSGNVAIIIIAVFAVIVVALIVVIIILVAKKKKKPTN